MARQLGLPVQAVSVPSHLFIRYDDGRVRANIELLEGGISFEDQWYVQRYKVPKSSVRRGVYLRVLSDQEVLGHIYASLGVQYSKAGDYGSSRVLYEAALAQAPQLPTAYYNLGNDLLAQEKFNEAIKRFNQSLHLDPSNAWVFNNRGLAFCREGKLHRARKDFEGALNLDPSCQLAAQNLSDLGCDSKAGKSR
jgi:tetratricopeptide (TPR) repeat protein